MVANLQASKPGNCWNDAGDAFGMPAGCCRHQRLRIAGMLLVMPLACLQVGNLQASKPGNCWNDAGDWQPPAGIKAWELLE